ncbi:MAG: PKD domain-containing protein [Bacteriovoracaceae bacterium]|nr:PKD domain-containing protein [Bacteriovoracaceae bacterium]
MKLVVVIIILITSASLWASNKCSIKGTKLIYVNGIQTPEADAKKTMDLLHLKIVYTNFDSSKQIKPEMRHNYNESFRKDVLESIVQKIPDSFLEFMQLSDPYAAFRSFIGEKGRLWVELTQSLFYNDTLALFSDYIQNYDKDSRYINDRVALKELYETALNDQYRVLAISHSQGGLFMEDSFSDIATDKKFKYFIGFQVATPVSFTNIPKYGYATHDLDKAMWLVRPLSYNINAPEDILSDPGDSEDQFLRHGILTTYLFDSRVEKLVLEKLYEATSQIESNCPVAVFEHEIESDGFNVNFDATDPERLDLKDILYNWDFGDGPSEITSSKYINHKYEKPGKYTVVLRLTRNDGSLFWDKGTIVKEIEVGTLIQGCNDAVGKYHINPDGTVGGFVSNTATVAETSYISPIISICGNSQILGASSITSADTLPLNQKLLTDVLIIDTTIKSGNYLSILESMMSNVQMVRPSDFIMVEYSNISDSAFDINESNSYLIFWNSNVVNTTISGHGFNIEDASVSGMNFLSLIYPLTIYGDYIYYGDWSGTLANWPY